VTSRPPVSRRGLLSLSWARRPPRASLGPWRAVLHERWDGAAALVAALGPPADALAEAAGAVPGRDVLVVAAGDGAIAAAVAARGASAAVEADPSDAEDLPFFEGAFDAVVGGLGALFAPRPVRAARELLRVLSPGGRLVLAVPAPGSFLAQALELSLLHDGVPPPQAWGREEVLRGRLDTAAPGIDVELRALPVRVGFASESAAWEACHGALGIPPDRREAFADLVTARSSSRAEVRMDDVYTLALACRR
jgi:SAM-dependent methyltransferase